MCLRSDLSGRTLLLCGFRWKSRRVLDAELNVKQTLISVLAPRSLTWNTGNKRWRSRKERSCSSWYERTKMSRVSTEQRTFSRARFVFLCFQKDRWLALPLSHRLHFLEKLGISRVSVAHLRILNSSKHRCAEKPGPLSVVTNHKMFFRSGCVTARLWHFPALCVVFVCLMKWFYDLLGAVASPLVRQKLREHIIMKSQPTQDRVPHNHCSPTLAYRWAAQSHFMNFSFWFLWSHWFHP